MSKLGRIGTMISLCVETKSMFNELRMEGINMSESIRDHIRFLYNSRLGIETKSVVEHHWESLQDDRKEYEDALIKIEAQQERFLQNLPRNIAMHEKSRSILTWREKHRWGRLNRLRKLIQLEQLTDPSFDEEMKYQELRDDLLEIISNWDENNWGIKPDIITPEGREEILNELDMIDRKRFVSKASIEQIEIRLEAEGKIPDLMIGNIAKHLLHQGDEP